jgi:WhiB family redox-sensing transcriptional regulator
MAERLLRAGETGERTWLRRANCLGIDPELFFPQRGMSTREAKAVCQDCRVRSECLEYAVVHGEKFGIWGGLTERERRRVRRAGLALCQSA